MDVLGHGTWPTTVARTADAYVARMQIADEVAAAIYRRAGCNPMHPPQAGSIEVAAELFGGNVLRFLPHAHAEAGIATLWGEQRIVIRTGTSVPRMNFLIAQQTGRLFLANDAWFGGLQRIEQTAVTLRIGAWIVAPPPAFLDQVGRTGADLGILSNTFVITETCAAIRSHELCDRDVVVTTPTTVHRRGKLLSGLGDSAVRDLAACRQPKSVRKVPICDENDRVALFARSA